jgi:RND family efflux transporter MFP subunit
MSTAPKPAPKLLHFFLAGALLAGGLFAAKALVESKQEIVAQPPEILPPLVEVQVVEPVQRRLEVRTEGEVTALDQVALSAQVSGTALEVAPELIVGGFVERDQLLVRIDASDYLLALESAEAALAEAQAALTLEEAQAESSVREWEAVSDAPPSALVRREPQLAAARARIATAEAGIAKARLDLERTELRAPFDARVLAEDIDRGQLVALGQPIATLVSVEAVEIPVSLTEADLQALALPANFGLPGGPAGPPARVVVSGSGDQVQWSGRVVRTGGQLDPRTRTRTAFVRVDAPYGDPVGTLNHDPLVLGTFVRVFIEGRSLEDVIALPRKALKRGDEIYRVRFDEATGAHHLQRLDARVLAQSPDELLLSRDAGGHRLEVEFVPDGSRTANELVGQVALALGVPAPELRERLVEGEQRYAFEIGRLRGALEATERAVAPILEFSEHSLAIRPLRLEPGDLLVTSALEVVVDGMPVRVASASGGAEPPPAAVRTPAVAETVADDSAEEL